METITIPKAEYQKYLALEARCTELEQQVQFFMEQNRLARQQRFGASSEKTPEEQINLFDEAELLADDRVQEPELEEVRAHYRKKSSERQKDLPDDLPVEEIEHILPPEERGCPHCDQELVVIGKRERETLKIIPAKALIERHIQYVYGCRNCEKNDCSTPIVRAAIDLPLIPKSMATPETVAYVMTQKFVMGVPLYRQEQEWDRQGLPLSRQTMSNWLLRCAEDYLTPIYARLKEQLLQETVLHADETTLQVLREEGKSPQSKSYMWLYRTGRWSPRQIVLYEYQPDRKMERPQDFLLGFCGYLHADGYAGYHALPKDIVVVGCWAHARRKFEEALKSIPEKSRAGSLAMKGKKFCDRLFLLERKFEELSPEDRKKQREEKSRPILEDFFQWVHSFDQTGRSTFGEAIKYVLGQELYLRHYLLDGRLAISNNRAERSIKPFVIGRKNFLFANTVRGAEASSVIYSLVETAKENKLNPYEYLVWVMQKAPGLDLKNNPDNATLLLPELFKKPS
jgi:transposase